MLQLVNFSNSLYDVKMLGNDIGCLKRFLKAHQLDGLELMICEPWTKANQGLATLAKGVHLKFWPFWLDFWRENRPSLRNQFGSDEQIAAYYNAANPQEWLDVYQENIRMAVALGAEYLVFHVGNTRKQEVFTWNFHADDREVVQATVELINELAYDIPETVTLLFENLWWPGLTLKNNDMLPMLFEGVRHKNTGIMLDTGHLMHTNPQLATEEEGVEYVLKTLAQLGTYSEKIKGIHLHQSLSGEYIKAQCGKLPEDDSMLQVLAHVMKIDRHLPFQQGCARRILEWVQPNYLIHEFIYDSVESWSQKLQTQQRALWGDLIEELPA